MAVTINTSIFLGPMTNRTQYRVTEISAPKPYYRKAGSYRVVTLVRTSDGSTWEVNLKSGAKSINWNATLRRVLTVVDRERALREEQARVAQEWPYLTRVRVGSRLGVVKGTSKWLDRLTVDYDDGGMGDPLISIVEKVEENTALD